MPAPVVVYNFMSLGNDLYRVNHKTGEAWVLPQGAMKWVKIDG